MVAIFLKAAALNFGVQWCCWAVDLFLKNQKYYDVTGALMVAVLSLTTLNWGNTFYVRQIINTGLATAWACRLVFHLVKRNMKYGEDHRYTIIHKPSELLTWTMQGVWVMATVLPVMLVNAQRVDLILLVRDDLGWFIWIIGFVLECVADYQKSTFKANPDNAGKFIQRGLWSVCRHPNYVGEIMMWTGIYLSATSVLSGFEHAAIISPTFVAFVLVKVSGVPLLEKSGAVRWGDDPNYKAYISRTAKLIPYIW